MEHFIGAIASAIPTAIVGFLFWRFERKIDARDKAHEKAEASDREQESKREKSQEELMFLLIESTTASINLCEATARAVQRIPDAHCNGDMHTALDYSSGVKQKLEGFLARQGVSAIVR